MTLDINLLKKIENFKRHILKSIPLPSTNTPSSDSTNGSTGSSLEYARSDHQHPKSTLYAESEHNHNDILSDLMDNINNTTIVVDSPNPIGQDGDTILLIGKMYDDDISGKSIDYYIDNTLIGSSVTNSNGVSFLDYECDGLGVRNVTAKNGSIVSKIFTIIDNPSEHVLKVLGDKNILSYVDNDELSLTATLTDLSDNPIVGEDIIFKKGSTVLDTIPTDSDGVAEYIYNSQGVGDVTFTVECMNLQETFVVEDCIKYDTNTYNLSPNSAIVQIANTEFVNTDNWQVEWEQNLPSSNCRCVLYPSNNTNEYLGIGTPTNNVIRLWETNDATDYGSYPFNSYYHITFKKQNNTISIFANDNKLKDSTHSAIISASDISVGVRNWGSGTGTIKNIKIKPL